MSVNAELAAAARWISAAAERLPDEKRPDLAAAWGELTDNLEDCRSEGSKHLRSSNGAATWKRGWRQAAPTGTRRADDPLPLRAARP
jgi:hypothetical protein